MTSPLSNRVASMIAKQMDVAIVANNEPARTRKEKRARKAGK